MTQSKNKLLVVFLLVAFSFEPVVALPSVSLLETATTTTGIDTDRDFSSFSALTALLSLRGVVRVPMGVLATLLRMMVGGERLSSWSELLLTALPFANARTRPEGVTDFEWTYDDYLLQYAGWMNITGWIMVVLGAVTALFFYVQSLRHQRNDIVFTDEYHKVPEDERVVLGGKELDRALIALKGGVVKTPNSVLESKIDANKILTDIEEGHVPSGQEVALLPSLELLHLSQQLDVLIMRFRAKVGIVENAREFNALLKESQQRKLNFAHCVSAMTEDSHVTKTEIHDFIKVIQSDLLPFSRATAKSLEQAFHGFKISDLVDSDAVDTSRDCSETELNELGNRINEMQTYHQAIVTAFEARQETNKYVEQYFDSLRDLPERFRKLPLSEADPLLVSQIATWQEGALNVLRTDPFAHKSADRRKEVILQILEDFADQIIEWGKKDSKEQSKDQLTNDQLWSRKEIISFATHQKSSDVNDIIKKRMDMPDSMMATAEQFLNTVPEVKVDVFTHFVILDAVDYITTPNMAKADSKNSRKFEKGINWQQLTPGALIQLAQQNAVRHTTEIYLQLRLRMGFIFAISVGIIGGTIRYLANAIATNAGLPCHQRDPSRINRYLGLLGSGPPCPLYGDATYYRWRPDSYEHDFAQNYAIYRCWSGADPTPRISRVISAERIGQATLSFDVPTCPVVEIPGTNWKTEKVCAGQQFTLQCELGGALVIKSASLGQDGTLSNKCLAAGTTTAPTSCEEDITTDIDQQCGLDDQCQLWASTALSSTCAQVQGSYLTVKYSCISMEEMSKKVRKGWDWDTIDGKLEKEFGGLWNQGKD